MWVFLTLALVVLGVCFYRKNEKTELRGLHTKEVIDHFSNNVIEWNEYYPSLENAHESQKLYYKYRKAQMLEGKYVDLGVNLAYLFCYTYEIFNDFIYDKDIGALESKRKHLLSMYGDTKVRQYVDSWMADAYVYVGDYHKGRTVEKNSGFLDISKMLFYGFHGVKIEENGDSFLSIFGKSFLTKFGKENIDGVKEVLDVFLKNFQEIHGMNFIEYFCQDFQKDTLTENDIIKYKDFYKDEDKFYEQKALDEESFDRGIRDSLYIYTYKMSLLQGIPLEKRNKKQPKSETIDTPAGPVRITISLGMEMVSGADYVDISTPIKAPGGVIEFALRDYAKQTIRDCENTYRDECGIPRIGEGRVSETNLFYKIKERFPEEKVVHHGKPQWIGRQHLDIYLPDRNIGIEYQGEQHNRPVEYFGGKDAYKKQVRRDIRKKKKCDDNGCALIYVFEGYEIDDVVENIKNNF